MTENEIIDFLEDEINGLKEQKYGDVGEIAAEVFKEINGDGRIKVFSAAITALEEIQQYREIGTVEECREAREKQKPMKVKEVHVDEYYCPACGSENCCDQGIVGDRYCPYCGHAIDENLEGMEE